MTQDSRKVRARKLQGPKQLDPSHVWGPPYVNSKRPFPATKRAFEVNKGRTDDIVSTSRYERIVKFGEVFVMGVEVFVPSNKDLCAGALLPSGASHAKGSDERPFPIVRENYLMQIGFGRTVWSGLSWPLQLSPNGLQKPAAKPKLLRSYETLHTSWAQLV